MVNTSENLISRILVPGRISGRLANELASLFAGEGPVADAERMFTLLFLAMAWSTASPWRLTDAQRTVTSLMESQNPAAAALRLLDMFERGYETAPEEERNSDKGSDARQAAVLAYEELRTSEMPLLNVCGMVDARLRYELSWPLASKGELILLDVLANLFWNHGEVQAAALCRRIMAAGARTRLDGQARSEPGPQVYVSDQSARDLVMQLLKKHGLHPLPSGVQSGGIPQAGIPAHGLPAIARDSKPTVAVFSPEAAREVLAKQPSIPGESNGKQRLLLQDMAEDTGLRVLTEVPQGNPLAELYERFPHFTEVLDFVAKSLALAGCGDEGRPARIPPILLRGEPGTGKTYFAQELARVLGTEFVERDLSVTTEAFVISGMDAGWKNSKPGIVFDALVDGKTANPLICLNEVDKAAVTGNHNSPLAPMYALLEPTSAKRFADEFIPVTLDASHVIWVLTANNGPIPEPILSRLEVFDIKAPSTEECRAIAASVWKSICERTLPRGHGFPQELPESVLEHMSRTSPRIMRKALTSAAANAAFHGRKHLELADLDASAKRYEERPARAPIGFVH